MQFLNTTLEGALSMRLSPQSFDPFSLLEQIFTVKKYFLKVVVVIVIRYQEFTATISYNINIYNI